MHICVPFFVRLEFCVQLCKPVAMAIPFPGAFHCSTAPRAIVSALCVLGVLVPDAAGRRHHQQSQSCAPFSCGRLGNVSSPFRRRGDPPECGVASYELTCSHGDKATIQIDDATYFVTSINYSDSVFQSKYYTDSTFWVVDASILDSSNNCPLPRWNRIPYYENSSIDDDSRSHGFQVELEPHYWSLHFGAYFVTCSQEVANNGMYRPVACLSNSSSFVYVLTGTSSSYIESLEPSCGFMAMTPLGSWPWSRVVVPENVSYADVVKLMRGGFAIQFPYTLGRRDYSSLKKCMSTSFQEIHEEIKPGKRVDEAIMGISMLDLDFWDCATGHYRLNIAVQAFLITTEFSMWCFKWIAVLCRFVLAPLVISIFLAHKYWRRRITIDAVEKFLRMQLMHGPTRYAYSDITAITAHFREKLGQGGYGSVYKGVLQPGDVRVAVKVLGSSNCNGEEFISEVSTIGRIHHVNVVRLVGFCAEEMRRALVYDYMPHGSLDRFIFSPGKSFSWDKLNEIALGIAGGINYLHQGCEMQILHFDIKPHNILLDGNFVPKVADFGLAKLYPRDNSFVPVSAARGTIGYIAPEMITRSFGVISSKSDVYSFGMLLLEMAGGRRNSNQNMSSSSQAYYPSWVYTQLLRQEMGKVATGFNMHDLEKKLCIVGLHCIQMKPHDRPTMSEAIEMLQGGVDGLQLPSRPFFCDDEPMAPLVDSYHFSSELTEI